MNFDIGLHIAREYSAVSIVILTILQTVSTSCLLQMFAFGLNSLFELLDVNEDCYGVGYLSKVIATELANLPSARMRRKVNDALLVLLML